MTLTACIGWNFLQQEGGGEEEEEEHREKKALDVFFCVNTNKPLRPAELPSTCRRLLDLKLFVAVTDSQMPMQRKAYGGLVRLGAGLWGGTAVCALPVAAGGFLPVRLSGDNAGGWEERTRRRARRYDGWWLQHRRAEGKNEHIDYTNTTIKINILLLLRRPVAFIE
ncbi:unnamed protein product [Discosporangium mesarthrocarpum]